MPPFILWRSAGAAKVEGFDPILAIGCDNRYITYSVINPPPTAAGVVDGVVRGANSDSRNRYCYLNIVVFIAVICLL